jgi:hypothetical protein
MSLAHWTLYLQIFGYIILALWKLLSKEKRETKQKYERLVARMERNEREYIRFRLKVAAKLGLNGDF